MMATKPQTLCSLVTHWIILRFISACIISMLLKELILPGHCASCYAVSADSLPTTIIMSRCFDLAFYLNVFTLSVYAHVSFAADTTAVAEGLLPHLSPPTSDVLHTCTLESLICNALCLLFIMLLRFPCITAAGWVPRSRFTPPSQTVFLLYLSPLAKDTSLSGRINNNGGTVKSVVREIVMQLKCHRFSYWINSHIFSPSIYE